MPSGARPTDFSAMRLSTDDLPAADRIAFSREVLGRQLMGLEVAPVGDEPFRMETTLRSMPGLAIVALTGSHQRVTRTRQLIAADGKDDLILSLPSTGSTFVSLVDSRVDPGDGTLYPAYRAGFVEAASGTRCRAVLLPFGALTPMIKSVDPKQVGIIRGDSEAMRLLAGYLDMLEGAGPITSAEIQQRIAAHVHDLAALAVGAGKDATAQAAARGLRAARLQAVTSDIARHMDDSRLSVVDVARRQGLTPRYIQLLFEGQGTTFTQYLVRQRLARAHRMLTSARFADRSITSIAFDAGFGDLSYFDRVFRRVYGVRPSDTRADALWRQS